MNSLTVGVRAWAPLLVGCGVVLRNGASLRAFGTGDSFCDVFLQEENRSFPFHLTGAEAQHAQRVFQRGVWLEEDEASAPLFLRLALDDIVEIRMEGKWLSSLKLAEVLLDLTNVIGPDDRYATLIASRLLWATEADRLARLLYSSGRWPMSSASLSAADRVLDEVDRLAFGRSWHRLTTESPGWIGWRNAAPSANNPLQRARAKVYLSVPPSYLEEHWAAITSAVFSIPEAVEAKVASSTHGLHRPDALVIYGNDSDDIPAIASGLLAVTATAPPSAMTFSPPFAASANVFWGIDPLTPEHLVYGESWRRAVCTRCAHLVARLHKSTGANPIKSAMAGLLRFQLEGVDTQTWIPPYARELAAA